MSELRAASISERNIWTRNPDRVLDALEQDFYLLGHTYLVAVQLTFLELFHLPIHVIKADTAAQAHARSAAYSTALEQFRSLIQRRAFTVKDAPELAHAVTEKWYGEGRLSSRAEASTVRSFLCGYIRHHPAAPTPATLPSRVREAVARYRLERPTAETLEWARLHAAEHVTHLKEKARHAVAEMVFAAEREGMSPNALSRNLLTRLGSVNRDWRMMAITEASMNYANGQLTASIGQELEWVGAADACPHCRQYVGQRFKVVRADATGKDFHRVIWPGKTNLGRSFHPRTREGRVRGPDELAGPVIPAHPHDRCRWKVVSAKAADPRLEAYLLGALGGD